MARTKVTPKKTLFFTCACCMDERTVSHAALLPCHPDSVCRLCLRKWYNQSHTCPVCRTPVTDHAAVNGTEQDFLKAQGRQERRKKRQREEQEAMDERMARRLARTDSFVNAAEIVEFMLGQSSLLRVITVEVE
jgi:hypothetical protein